MERTKCTQKQSIFAVSINNCEKKKKLTQNIQHNIPLSCHLINGANKQRFQRSKYNIHVGMFISQVTVNKNEWKCRMDG